MDGNTMFLFLLAAGLAVYYLFRKYRNYHEQNGIPHVPILTDMGTFVSVIFRRCVITETIQEAYNLYPDAKYIGFYGLTKPTVMIRDPEIIKSICVKNFNAFPDRRTGMDVDHEPLFTKNLLALRGQRWRDVRNLLSPFFTSSKIKGMFKLMCRCADNFTDSLTDLLSEKNEIDTKDALSRYTNDVIASCAFGIQVDSMKDREDPFYVNGTKITEISFTRLLRFLSVFFFPKPSKWLGIRLLPKDMTDFFQNMVHDIVETRDRTGLRQPDMIQLMMESRGKYQDREDLTLIDMTANAFLFFIAGFETTSNLLCFAAHEIALNPDIQEKLQAEIDEVLRSTEGKVTYEAINEMKYLEAVIYETLRKYPVAFIHERESGRSFELPPALPGLKPFVLKKNTRVLIPAYSLQRDSNYFEAPDRFYPDRFLGDPKRILNCGAYLPFGLGPRMCIGNRFVLLETKVLFFHLLARCDLIPCSRTTLKFSKKIPMHADGGFWLKVQRRNKLPADVPDLNSTA